VNLLSFSGLIAIPLISSPVVYLAGRLGSHDATLHRRSYFVRTIALLAVLTCWFPFVQAAQGLLTDGVQEFHVDTILLRVDGISRYWQVAFLARDTGDLVLRFLYDGRSG
jgi:hypothetical protein